MMPLLEDNKYVSAVFMGALAFSVLLLPQIAGFAERRLLNYMKTGSVWMESSQELVPQGELGSELNNGEEEEEEETNIDNFPQKFRTEIDLQLVEMNNLLSPKAELIYSNEKQSQGLLIELGVIGSQQEVLFSIKAFLNKNKKGNEIQEEEEAEIKVEKEGIDGSEGGESLKDEDSNKMIKTPILGTEITQILRFWVKKSKISLHTSSILPSTSSTTSETNPRFIGVM